MEEMQRGQQPGADAKAKSAPQRLSFEEQRRKAASQPSLPSSMRSADGGAESSPTPKQMRDRKKQEEADARRRELEEASRQSALENERARQAKQDAMRGTVGAVLHA